jgi:hypothetical protein
MDHTEKSRLRPFKRNFFELFPPTTMDAAVRRFFLVSLRRHQEICPNEQGADRRPTPRCSLDEFPAGYSLTACSPARRLCFTSQGDHAPERTQRGNLF